MSELILKAPTAPTVGYNLNITTSIGVFKFLGNNW